MTSTLNELCKHIQTCTEKLEEEIKRNIDACHKLLISNEATETKLALEKAKDYHYKEILDFLREIVTNIRKIIFHEEKIRTLSDENSITPEELKRYSYVQRQINVFSNNEEYNVKREKRRVASEISLESLEAWEQYLEKKDKEEKVVPVEKSEIPKRKRMNSKRRKKKFVSSTFNNFLDGRTESRKLDSILESDDAQEDDLNSSDRLSDQSEDLTKDCDKNLNLESEVGLNTHDNGSVVNKEDTSSYKHKIDEESMIINSLIFEYDSDGEDKKQNRLEIPEKDSVLDVVETINKELCLQEPSDSKPRIVDVVYKKNSN